MTPALTDFIRRLLAVPYKKGGRGYDGASCKGLVLLFYRDFLGIPLPDIQGDEPGGYAVASYHELFERVERPRRFDIVAFQDRKENVDHGGVVLDNGKFIHCSRITGGVSVEYYNAAPYGRRLAGFYRYKHGHKNKD